MRGCAVFLGALLTAQKQKERRALEPESDWWTATNTIRSAQQAERTSMRARSWLDEQKRHGVLCAEAKFPPVSPPAAASRRRIRAISSNLSTSVRKGARAMLGKASPPRPRYSLSYTTYFAPHHHDWSALHSGQVKLPILVHLFGGGFLIGTSGFNHCVSIAKLSI